MSARPYQKSAEDACFKEWEEHRSTMIVLPTGCGKTHVIAAIVKRFMPKRSIIIAHRGELLWQAADKIKSVAGLDCEIEKADFFASVNLFNRTPVVVASVQTLISKNGDKKRMTRFNPMEFGCLLVDENHHSVADSYKEIIRYFMDGNPDLKLFGCTATPDRSDEEALGQVYESVAYDYEIIDAIEDGWLVPIEEQMVHIESLDYEGIRTTCGDLNGADLATVMEDESNLQKVAAASIEIIGNRRSLVFASSVRHAEMLSNIFNRHRIGMSNWICGKTTPEVRKQVLDQFAYGSTQVVCNCGCLTEGFDNPGVEVIIMGRPTKSRALFSQMVGRSTRPLPGIVDRFDLAEDRRNAIASSAKPSCLVVDFTGNCGKHRLMTTADILGGNVSDEVIERVIENAKKEGTAVRMSEALAAEADRLARELEEKKIREEARKTRLVAKVKFSTTHINPFNALGINPPKERGWDSGKSLSEKQRGVLLRAGINPDDYGYAQGRAVLNEMFRRFGNKLCTLKQASTIKKFYPHMDTKNMTMKNASSLIDALAKNNWRAQEKAVA